MRRALWITLALLVAFPLVCLVFFLPTGSGPRSDPGVASGRRTRHHADAAPWS